MQMLTCLSVEWQPAVTVLRIKVAIDVTVGNTARVEVGCKVNDMTPFCSADAQCACTYLVTNDTQTPVVTGK